MPESDILLLKILPVKKKYTGRPFENEIEHANLFCEAAWNSHLARFGTSDVGSIVVADGLILPVLGTRIIIFGKRKAKKKKEEIGHVGGKTVVNHVRVIEDLAKYSQRISLQVSRLDNHSTQLIKQPSSSPLDKFLLYFFTCR